MYEECLPSAESLARASAAPRARATKPLAARLRAPLREDVRSAQFELRPAGAPCSAFAVEWQGLAGSSTAAQGVGIFPLAWCGSAPHGREGEQRTATPSIPVPKQSSCVHAQTSRFVSLSACLPVCLFGVEWGTAGRGSGARHDMAMALHGMYVCMDGSM